MIRRTSLILGTLMILGCISTAPTSPSTSPPIAMPASISGQPRITSLEAYLQAAKEKKMDSPTETNMEYSGYQPFPDEWMKVETEARVKNKDLFALARKARKVEFEQLSNFRSLANQLGDAMLYEHIRGNEAEAFELFWDLHWLDDQLRRPNKYWIELIVGAGIQSRAMHCIMVVCSDVRISDDPKDAAALNSGEASGLVRDMLSQRNPTDLIGASQEQPLDSTRILETLHRGNAEQTMVAMSMGCHLFKHAKNRWPNSLEELVPEYLLRIPVDPWGDGKQTFEYALIHGGLPDGSDRPLVWCRCRSLHGLFYHVDEPQYNYSPDVDEKQGGQFRDVARWAPKAPLAKGEPSTRPFVMHVK